MLFRLAHLGVTNVFALLRLLPCSDHDKDTEILVGGPTPAAHGGLWRQPYAPRSVLGIAMLLGVGAAEGSASGPDRGLCDPGWGIALRERDSHQTGSR